MLLLLTLAIAFVSAQPGPEPQWQTVTTDLPCAIGVWTYFYRIGLNSNKLLIEFEGGGGCWDEDTCSTQPLYKEEVDIEDTLAALRGGGGTRNHRDERNPFQEWTHLYVPYCSGDIFAGDNIPAWGVEHRGWWHGQTAYEWVVANMPRPTHVMVTGCSAGGYGAVMWAPRYFQLFRSQSPLTRMYMFADSSMGIATQSQLHGYTNDLNMTDFLLQGHVPAYAGMDFSYSQPESYLNYSSDIVGLAADEYPNAMFSLFTANKDSFQYYYTWVGGLRYTPEEWSQGMRQVKQLAVNKGAGNVASWIDPGVAHCVIVLPAFYRTQVNGIMLYDWLGDMVNDRPFPLDVDCARDEGNCEIGSTPRI